MNPNLIIQAGDSYNIPFQLTFEGEAVTSNNVTAVRIQVGPFLKSYPGGDLAYTTDGVWQFPLTESESRALQGEVEWQCAIKRDNSTFYSRVEILDARKSIILDNWNINS